MGETKVLTILHFNDIYDIDARGTEPCGGAARMVTKIKSYGGEALVTFGGDAYNPSILSTLTQGKQMTAIMNQCGVHVAGAGNHDFDYGVDNFVERAGECNFPWLMANIIERASGKPMGGCKPSVLLE